MECVPVVRQGHHPYIAVGSSSLQPTGHLGHVRVCAKPKVRNDPRLQLNPSRRGEEEDAETWVANISAIVEPISLTPAGPRKRETFSLAEQHIFLLWGKH